MCRSALPCTILLALAVQIVAKPAAQALFLQSQDIICSSESTAVVLVVDPQLVSEIRSNLSQFEEDLCRENYTVIERTSDFTTPLEVRSHLSGLYEQTDGKLEGVIFIGEIPRAYQWVRIEFSNPAIPPFEEEVISFQFYSDLDGTFAASPNYTSPGNHAFSYDQHTGEVDWEIWSSILPLYKGSVSQTADAINWYFVKNHLYRTGGYDLPEAFLQVNEHHQARTLAEHQTILNALRTGQYSWRELSDRPSARLYFDSPPGGLSVDQGYTDLTRGVANFTVLDAHGWAKASGKLTLQWVESNPLKTVFLWSNGCAVGNLDFEDNFLTSTVYSPTSRVLFAKGTTNDSGGMGNNEEGFFGHNIASQLVSGANFGQAILAHVNVPLIWPWSDSREFHFATPIVIGDPTLKLRPSGVTSVNSNVEHAATFALHQNYPNPFNPTTKIRFWLPKTASAKLIVYNALGQEIATLLNGVKPSGNYVIEFDGGELSSGVYFYRLQTDEFSQVRKMLLIR